MKWLKTGKYSRITDIFTSKYGLTEQEILRPERTDACRIRGFERAVSVIKQIGFVEKRPIVIVGDYDCDGTSSSAILYKLFSRYGRVPEVRIPKRMSEGYGMKPELIGDIKDSLLIAVDNGITAHEAISLAKKNGNTVVILDHHVPGETLPEADVIVDLCMGEDTAPFRSYCAAGLVLKLAEYMTRNDSRPETAAMMQDIRVLGCIGTIGDVMPLVGDNRCIVIDGLEILNKHMHELSAGIRSLFRSFSGEITEEDISFTVGPMINSLGRLKDSGGQEAFEALIETDTDRADAKSEYMVQTNRERKNAVADWYDTAAKQAEQQSEEMFRSGRAQIITAVCTGMPEGIIGVVAGKLADRYHVPVFVFSSSDNDPSVYKGSARSAGDFSIAELLPRIQPLLLAGGGHAGAAGLSVSENRLQDLTELLHAAVLEPWCSLDGAAAYYDAEISEEDAGRLFYAAQKYAPFGEGMEKPAFAIRNFRCVKRYGETYRLLGERKDTVKLTGRLIEALGFTKSAEYLALGCPETVDLLGTLKENSFNGKRTIQLQIKAMRKSGEDWEA